MSDEKTIVAPQGSTDTGGGELDKRARPVLLQYDGGAAGKRFVLEGNAVVLGRRADKVQVWIDDASVSREHCRLDFQGTKAFVTDMGSLNHTFINDQMILGTGELAQGDMLRVGNIRLRYFAHGSADQVLYDRIYRMLVFDKLLDILRKEYFLERLEEEFRLAKQTGQAASLLFFDLDKFKNINDTYGHDAGDFVLKEVCNTIKGLLRDSGDAFGRYGGEEFCIVLPRADLQESIAFAENVRTRVEQTSYDYEGARMPVTLSIGVSQLAAEIATPLDWIKATDALVYQAKRNGRNRVEHA